MEQARLDKKLKHALRDVQACKLAHKYTMGELKEQQADCVKEYGKDCELYHTLVNALIGWHYYNQHPLQLFGDVVLKLQAMTGE